MSSTLGWCRGGGRSRAGLGGGQVGWGQQAADGLLQGLGEGEPKVKKIGRTVTRSAQEEALSDCQGGSPCGTQNRRGGGRAQLEDCAQLFQSGVGIRMQAPACASWFCQELEASCSLPARMMTRLLTKFELQEQSRGGGGARAAQFCAPC